MHFCQFSTFCWSGLALIALSAVAYLMIGETWRRVFNKPKRLVVPITKEDQELNK